jgi:hypothetical protein
LPLCGACFSAGTDVESCPIQVGGTPHYFAVFFHGR